MARTLSLWISQVIVALIFLQTMFFKLTYAPETQLIFGDLGGRPAATLAALAELAAAILLFIPRTAAAGAALSLGIISGAIATHLFKIGIVVNDDGGTLFIMALVVFALSGFVAFTRRAELPVIGAKLNRTKLSPVAAA